MANQSNFGVQVSNALAEARLTQSEVATSARISQPYFNQMLTGLKKPSPEWVDIIASTLNFDQRQRQELHLAAAKDHGFKL